MLIATSAPSAALHFPRLRLKSRLWARSSNKFGGTGGAVGTAGAGWHRGTEFGVGTGGTTGLGLHRPLAGTGTISPASLLGRAVGRLALRVVIGRTRRATHGVARAREVSGLSRCPDHAPSVHLSRLGGLA